MKKIIRLTLCLLLLYTGSYATDIKGRILNYNGGRVTLTAMNQTVVKVAPDGTFHEQVTTTETPSYVYLIWEDHGRVQMNVAHSDQVEILIEPLPGERLKATFSGDRAAWNNYVSHSDREFLYYITHRELVKEMSFTIFRDKMLGVKEELLRLLEKVEDLALRNSGMDKLNVQFTSFLIFHYWARKVEGQVCRYEPEFETFMQSIDPNDPANIKSGLTSDRINWEADVAEQQEKNEDIRYLNILQQLVHDPEVVNELAYTRMSRYLDGADEELERVYALFQKICTDSAKVKALEPQYLICRELLPGKDAPDVIMADTAGNSVSLKNLRGKMLYIDVWATWCTPCKMEIPHLEKLYQHFKGDRRIQIVSLSIDGNADEWKRMLRKDKPEWAQYIVPKENKREFSKTYGIGGIPRFILIDEDGKIVSINARRPSYAQIISYLEEYLEQK